MRIKKNSSWYKISHRYDIYSWNNKIHNICQLVWRACVSLLFTSIITYTSFGTIMFVHGWLSGGYYWGNSMFLSFSIALSFVMVIVASSLSVMLGIIYVLHLLSKLQKKKPTGGSVISKWISSKKEKECAIVEFVDD